jgi:light-regulated signal transduction histidine kinase (bacteriophytochrome)
METGAVDYLVKEELNPSALERSIRYAMDHARSKRELQEAYARMEQRVEQRTAELAEANMALKRSSEKIKLFAYSVAHDLRNPTIGVYGLADRLKKKYGDILDVKGRNYCDRILNAAREIMELTDSINVYISTKEAPVFFERLDLEQIIQSVREEFTTQLNVRGIHWSQSREIPAVAADRLCMVRALRNLVDNAIKYGGDQLTEISVEYGEHKGFHILSVRDDGSGLEEKEAQEIFHFFTRGKGSKDVQGSGLGLAVVNEIAERHKGGLWAEPARPRGTVVSFSIDKNLLAKL